MTESDSFAAIKFDAGASEVDSGISAALAGAQNRSVDVVRRLDRFPGS